MIILMNPVMCLNFEFCIYIAWLQIPEWWMFVIVGIYIFHIFHIFKICMTIASRRPRWISLKFGGGLHTSRMCVSPNPRPTVQEPWGNIVMYHAQLVSQWPIWNPIDYHICAYQNTLVCFIDLYAFSITDLSLNACDIESFVLIVPSSST